MTKTNIQLIRLVRKILNTTNDILIMKIKKDNAGNIYYALVYDRVECKNYEIWNNTGTQPQFKFIKNIAGKL